MKEKDSLEKMCAAYGLGRCLGCERIHGGMVHKMWRLDTLSGSYAVEQLSDHAVKNPEIRADFDRCEAAAREFDAKGVPAVAALTLNDKTVYSNGDFFAVAYPWFDGTVQEKYEANLVRIPTVARLLASIHSIGAKMPEKGTFWRVMASDEDMETIQASAESATAGWSSRLIALLPSIEDLRLQCAEAFESLSSNLLMSHRDLNPTNILWDKNASPHVIDWESANATNPTLELLGTAIEWAMVAPGKVNEKAFKLFISSYAVEREVVANELSAALTCAFSQMLVWLRYNVEWATDNGRLEERNMRDEEVVRCLDWIGGIALNPDIVRWAGEVRS